MPEEMPIGIPKIGKSWPYGFINILPQKQMWKYLAWKSGGRETVTAVDLGKSLATAGRILIAMPADAREFFIALPVIQNLVRELEGAVFYILTGPGTAPLLESTFGKERCHARVLEEADLLLGARRFAKLRISLREFRPDVTVNLRIHSHPLLHFLFRCSLAPVRIELASDAHRPFANVTVRPGEPPNFLRHFLSVTRLWESAGRSVPVSWTRIKPSPERLEQAALLLSNSDDRGTPLSDSENPETFVLFLWQDLSEDSQWKVLEKIAGDWNLNGEDASLLVLHFSDPTLGTSGPSERVRERFRCLEADSPGLLLGVIALATKVFAMNGPLLHFASLTDAQVEAFFGPHETPYDTSFLNPLLVVNWDSV